MGLRRIHTDKEPSLHKVCKPVTSFDWRLHKLLNDMRDTLLDANGVGLAAPQVGILRRVVLVDTGEEILELINPELVSTSGEQYGAEGCLSVPGRYGWVKRPMFATVKAQGVGPWLLCCASSWQTNITGAFPLLSISTDTNRNEVILWDFAEFIPIRNLPCTRFANPSPALTGGCTSC